MTCAFNRRLESDPTGPWHEVCGCPWSDLGRISIAMPETESAQSPQRERTQPSEGGDSLEKMKRAPNLAKRLFQLLGPGFITGASDDDPSGIGTYAVAGALTGYATLWTALLT